MVAILIRMGLYNGQLSNNKFLDEMVEQLRSLDSYIA